MSFRLVPVLWLCAGIIAIGWSAWSAVFGPRVLEEFPDATLVILMPCVVFCTLLWRRPSSWITAAFVYAVPLLHAQSPRVLGRVRSSLRWLFRVWIASLVAAIPLKFFLGMTAALWERALMGSVALCVAWVGLVMTSYALLGARSIPFVPTELGKPGAR